MKCPVCQQEAGKPSVTLIADNNVQVVAHCDSCNKQSVWWLSFNPTDPMLIEVLP